MTCRYCEDKPAVIWWGADRVCVACFLAELYERRRIV